MMVFMRAGNPRVAGRRRLRTDLRVEGLETRLALSTVHVAISKGTETISGQVTNSVTGRGIGGVQVQLIDSNGDLVRTTRSGPRGNYGFHDVQDGPYIVRENASKRYSQVTPTFTNTAPTGGYATNPATGLPYNASNYNYHTGNSNPANGPVGPAFWDTIAPAGDLPFESPINLTGPTVDLSQYVTVNYTGAVPKAIANTGAQIQVQWPGSAPETISVAGTTFNLTNFHYHDPSENHAYGQAYNMEEHFVNTSSTGATTVLAVFLQLGAHNNSLDPILNAAATNLTSKGTTTITTPIDFSGLLPTNTQGWFYQGSLTTPPLSQPLNWFVYATPITLDAAQLQKYENVAGGSGFLPNARPLQPIDGRRLNEVDNDVNVAGISVSHVNFSLARTS